jgi:hypothetical protein
MSKCLFVILFVAGFVFAAKAQKPDTVVRKSKSDSVTMKHDSATSKKYVPKITKEKVYHPDSLHDPHKALIRSLIIPGWGQLYNHRWWKVPFIYGGLGLLGDAIIFNENYYSQFLKEDILREHGILTGRNANFQYISDADVDAATNSYRRDRDLCILGTIGAWGIQMIDAYVDAKFQQLYTMDNNLSFKIRPGMISQPAYAYNAFGTYIPAVTITFTLR